MSGISAYLYGTNLAKADINKEDGEQVDLAEAVNDGQEAEAQ